MAATPPAPADTPVPPPEEPATAVRRFPPPEPGPARLVVLASGTGSNLRALLDACRDEAYGARVVAVGTDRTTAGALKLAEAAGIPAFTVRTKDFADRAAWDARLTEETARHRPDLVVSAGFMKIAGPEFTSRYAGRFVNTHPALLPAFPGAHGVRDALDHGVKVTGCTVHFVDDGVDTGPIIAQGAVDVRPDDTEEQLHERIKTVEHRLLVDVVGRLAREGHRIEGRKVTIP